MVISRKITILLIILTLSGVGVLFYRTLRKSADKKSAPPVILNSSGNVVDQARQQEFNDAIKKLSASDKDLDGIPDAEEAKYKTNPVSSDTDEDGLTDQHEIFVFKTNPLKADTDGDGKADGYEMRHGLNPLVKEK
jgi:hypothetical protein